MKPDRRHHRTGAARIAGSPAKTGRRGADDGAGFYRAAIGRLQQARIPFLVGGAHALEALSGIVHRPKDLDLFVLPENADRCLSTLAQAGYRTELTFPHWLGKAFCGEEFIDIIFNSGNGFCRVDNAWFEHSETARVLSLDLKLCPVEEIIWQKAFLFEHNRCDVADVAHLLRQRGAKLDWERLLARFGHHWRVLVVQILLFDFVYPGHRDCIPGPVRERFGQLARDEHSDAVAPERACNGTLLSASRFLSDVDLEGYRDARLPPTGTLTREEIAIWTANFMQH